MENRYVPEILEWDVDWNKIKDACMQTISKRAGAKEPADEWKKKLLLSEHSPIRRSMVSIRWNEIPSYVSTHFCRHHIGVEKFVATSRADRTGVDRNTRPQTEFVSMQMDMNLQALINIMKKRLCTQSDPETQKYAWGLLKAVALKDPIVAWICVPEGIYRGGCSEGFGECRQCETILKQMPQWDAMVLSKRYDAYEQVKNRRMGIANGNKK